MKRATRAVRWATLPLMAWGLAACSGTDEITTQSLQPTQKVAIAEPDCGSIKAEIDKLNAAKLPEKLQQASATGAKKYSPTADEWSAFPRYNNLIEAYTVKKCEPSLQQAKAGPQKPKTKAAAVPGKTADASAAMKAAKPAVAGAAATPAKAAAAIAKPPAKAATTAAAAAAAAAPAAGQPPVYQGVMMQIPPQPAEPKP